MTIEQQLIQKSRNEGIEHGIEQVVIRLLLRNERDSLIHPFVSIKNE